MFWKYICNVFFSVWSIGTWPTIFKLAQCKKHREKEKADTSTSGFRWSVENTEINIYIPIWSIIWIEEIKALG